MTVFQILGISFCGLFALSLAAAVVRGRIRRGPGLAWVVLWVAAGVAIARPQLTKLVADWMGIDRGADLVFYVAIIAMLAGFFVVYLRLRRIDRTLTRIVRHIALEEAEAETERIASGAGADGR